MKKDGELLEIKWWLVSHEMYFLLDFFFIINHIAIHFVANLISYVCYLFWTLFKGKATSSTMRTVRLSET